jgi:hypothetical protein
MKDEQGLRFIFDNQKKSENFIYRSSNPSNALAENATIGVKFAQGVRFLDPWGFMLIGKTLGQRIIFRLKHPIAYIKRSWWFLYRRIKRIFIKERTVQCRKENEKD